jgi:DNA-binding NtrC family response regulator
VDARVIAATNVDLEDAVGRGRFREDLFHRLNVLRVHLPPLRERREDIAPLAHAFLARFSAEHRRGVAGFSRAALAALRAHDWPGNVRELVNRIRRAVILGEGRRIAAADLQLQPGASEGTDLPTLEQARDEAERQALRRSLAIAAGNPQRAAGLSASRATFYRLLEKHGLAPWRHSPFSGRWDGCGPASLTTERSRSAAVGLGPPTRPWAPVANRLPLFGRQKPELAE